ncbi:hypothetical protein [Pseudarthrobacter phenanthrenivorans]|uniref:hypothetical protein n=1 Tax=Pseudarthrobacter phenanthrenivorans TaxID=361575 RepID=UPI002F35802A
MSASHGRTVPAKRRFVWRPTTRTGKAALILDVLLAAFPLWILPSWYLVTFLAGAGGMFESPRAIAANSLLQAVVAGFGLLTNLVALLIARDHSIALVLAAVLLSAVLAYMGWYTSVFGVPGT